MALVVPQDPELNMATARIAPERESPEQHFRKKPLRFRAFGVATAIAIVTAAWMSPYCRTAEGDVGGRFAAALAVAAAAALIGWTANSAWAASGRWLALAAIGQAAALQLIDAGILIHYQHYRLPAQATSDSVLLCALVAVACQALFVTVGLAGHWAAIRAWLESRRHMAALGAVIVLCGSVAAAVSRDPRFFLWEAAMSLALQLVNAGNILLVVWALPTRALKTIAGRLDSLLGSPEEEGPASIDRFALCAALWVVVLSALLAFFVYERHPHVADEVVYLYNARYFAQGQITMPPPPVAAAFDVDLMEYRPDKWYGAVPVGWPAILAIGAAVGAPWLVNPVLAGFNVLLSYLLLSELYPRRTVRIAVLLLCVSPWHVFLAMSYMTHTATMTCSLLAFLGVARARRTGLLRWACLAGIGVGLGSTIRPLDGLIAAVLTAAWAIGPGGRRLRFPALAALGAATCLAGALALPYNKALTGSAITSPLMQYTDEQYGAKSNAYGFGPDRGLGWPTDAYPGHTPFEAVINAELNGATVNTELFGWSTGSILLIGALLVSGAVRRADYLMLAAIAAVVLAYAPYWGNGGPDFGARYWYLMLLPAIALSARGLESLEERMPAAGRQNVRATVAVAALCALALVNYFPWRSLDKYRHYLRMRPDVQALAKRHHFERSLILVRGERFPDYASAAIYNPLDLHANQPVYAWDRNPAVRAQVLREYADRPVWIVEGPSVTGAGFRVAAGPVSAAAAGARP